MLSTPSRITADIRRLCRKIGGLDEPVFVDVSARAGSGGADCFIDVRRQVVECGGAIQHGWMIWEWPGICAEGIFHAVWRKPEGQLIDVTRKTDGESRIAFAPDSKRVFAGRRTPTFRMAIGRDPRIKRWIDMNEELDRIVNRKMQGVPIGTEIVIEGGAYDLRERAALLSVELSQSREARRAQATSFQVP